VLLPLKKDISILHISTTDIQGGSGRSAYRIHTGLREHGIKSRMLVSIKRSNDPDVDFLSRGLLKFADRFCGKIFNSFSLQDLFYPSSFVLAGHPWFREADIIQLYNTHINYFTYNALPFLNKRKHVIWRLSDMWALTGHCSYSYDCVKWETGCGVCPCLDEYPPLKKDHTAFLWRSKKNAYDKLKAVDIVAPSLWIKNIAETSPLLKSFPVTHIPNGVDTGVFGKKDKVKARNILCIKEDAKVVLFISQNFHQDRRKGGQYLIEALSMLDESVRNNMVLLLIGNNNVEDNNNYPFRVANTGYMDSDNELANLYSSADIMVLPTLAENFPNTVLESMACGTPVVAFDTGGMSEVVIHMQTGYLAKLKDVQDLSNGIKLLLTDPERMYAMGQNGLRLMEERFTEDLETQRFMNLYEQMMGTKNE
jgi:glycosyltransferase involved in cell wall biosynthesis